VAGFGKRAVARRGGFWERDGLAGPDHDRLSGRSEDLAFLRGSPGPQAAPGTALLDPNVPEDCVMSADGTRLYIAGADGNLRVYDLATRTLLHSWDIGTKLGGIALSGDGSFLMVTEQVRPPDSGTNTSLSYRVDAVTGASVSMPGNTRVIGAQDVAILADDSVLITPGFYPPFAFPHLWQIDPTTGQYSGDWGPPVASYGNLVSTRDGGYLVHFPSHTGEGALYLHRLGDDPATPVAGHERYLDGVSGFNRGIQAVSGEAGLVAQFLYSDNIHIYRLEGLSYVLDLSSLGTRWSDVAGMAFDAAGRYLFILRSSTDKIYQLSVADWSLVQTIDVGRDVAPVNSNEIEFGNTLLISPDGRFIAVNTRNNVQLIERTPFADTQVGTDGDDALAAAGAVTVLHGLRGDDVLSGDVGNDILDGGIGDDALSGANGDDRLLGAVGSDQLDGGEGADFLNGGIGADLLTGGAGDDTYMVDEAGDVVVEVAGGGNDRVVASASYALDAAADVETLEAAPGRVAIDLMGNALAQTIIGNAGKNVLSGGGGADVLRGLGGDDTYLVDEAGPTIEETENGGNDRIVASIHYTLATLHIETLEAAAGTAPINLNGSVRGDTIRGNAGNNILDGRGGADVMAGRSGDDIYVVDSFADQVIEAAGEGNDRVFASVGYALAAGASVEILSTADNAGTAAINLTGSALANTILGNAGVNVLSGGDGDDLLDGKDGNDILRGGADNDTLYGREGNDLLHGGTGGNYLAGGAGDDQYVIESGGDRIEEAAGQGSDRAYASVSYALTAGASVEILSTDLNAGTAAINLTGNAFANTIIGNAGANVLNGLAGADLLDGKEGNDILYGGADNDTLYGREGNDTLYGGGGANYLAGGLGDDQYVIDGSGDYIEEAAGQGNDRIYASVSHVLAFGASVETLSTGDNAGTAAINLTGNEFANLIVGNAGANLLSGAGGNDVLDAKGGDDTLHGGLGDDTLYGGAGNDLIHGGTGANYLAGGIGDDRYVVDSGADTVVELNGEGADRIFASVSYTLGAGLSVETLSTSDNAGTAAIDLTGNALANTLVGNDGANILDGGAGSDFLDGKDGADIFAFTTALGAGNVDIVAGFVTGVDRLALDDAIFTALGAAGVLDAAAFVAGTAAADADDRIVYDGATGRLFYDADGNGAGAAILFATLQGAPTLAASDFLVI